MRICVIGNFSDRRCGFQNFSVQTVTALRRAGHEVAHWDGTYSAIEARRAEGNPTFFPADLRAYDVVQVIWNALTLNHYSGADWASLAGRPLISWWDGGPSDASCPFIDHMQVRWSDYPRVGYEYLWYPVPDWVTDLPPVSTRFTVGASSVRGDGVPLIREICARHGWALNLPEPEQWLSVEDEIRRLARSTVNVCWYDTPPIWHNRASAPSMLLAAGRPILINDDPLVAHLTDAEDIVHSTNLERTLEGLSYLREDICPRPCVTAAELSWTVAAARMADVWQAAGAGR